MSSNLADETTLADGPPSQLSMDLWKIITPNHFNDRLTPAFLLQLTIDVCKSTTPNQFHDGLTPSPPLIDHRSM